MPAKHPPSFDALSRNLIAWFSKHGRDYPWRRTTDPYAILVSEIMLQQTQITTVQERGYYTRWLAQFPDFESLAAASETAVLKAWEGLGYYRRARNLHKLAGVIIAEYCGTFPRDIVQIAALPGIGPYTAGAIASFAYNHAQPIVDGNVARVLSRIFNDTTPIDSAAGKKLLWDRATLLVRAAADPRSLNSALMELGQTLCKTGAPLCERCPVHKQCAATAPETLPVKQSKITITAVTERVFFLETSGGILLEQETGSRRTGLWKLPALPETQSPPLVLHQCSYGITRYKVTLWVHALPPQKKKRAWPANHRFMPVHELPALAMTAPHRRALEAVLRQRSQAVATRHVSAISTR